MGDKREPGRRLRRDDEQALEEIRRLFARYRQLARHGVVSERDRDDEQRREDDQLAGATGSSRGSGR
jgi:multidrug resistance efflux pump